jgi:hypothetical protein
MIDNGVLARIILEYLKSGELKNVLVGTSVDRVNSTEARLQDWSASTARLVLDAIRWHNAKKDVDIIKLSLKPSGVDPYTGKKTTKKH